MRVLQLVLIHPVLHLVIDPVNIAHKVVKHRLKVKSLATFLQEFAKEHFGSLLSVRLDGIRVENGRFPDPVPEPTLPSRPQLSQFGLAVLEETFGDHNSRQVDPSVAHLHPQHLVQLLENFPSAGQKAPVPHDPLMVNLVTLSLELLPTNQFKQVVSIQNENTFFVLSFTDLSPSLLGLCLPNAINFLHHPSPDLEIQARICLILNNILLDKVFTLALLMHLGGGDRHLVLDRLEIFLSLCLQFLQSLLVFPHQNGFLFLFSLLLKLLVGGEGDLHPEFVVFTAVRRVEDQVEV